MKRAPRVLRFFACCALVSLLSEDAANGEDWPQWGGKDPGRNMYSSAKGLPATFDPGALNPATGEFDMITARNIKWVAKLGSQSFGNVSVAGGKVFIGTNNDSPRDTTHQGDRSILMCFDENSGRFLWQLVVPKLATGKINDWEGLGILSSPAVEGNRVYLVTSRCEVICVTTEGLGNGNVGPFKDEGLYMVGPGKPRISPGPRDADIVWRYDMIKELGVFPRNGSCSSVLIVGDLVFAGTSNGMNWDAEIPAPQAPSFVALNKHTGELVAEDDAQIGPRLFHGQWGSASTGIVGDKQLVFFGGGDGFCYAFDSKPVTRACIGYLPVIWKADGNPPEYKIRNGKPIKYPHPDGPSEIAGTPVFWKNRVYVTTGQNPDHGEGVGNLVCIAATQTGDVTQSGVLWRSKQIHRTMSTASISPEGLLFIADFTGSLHCLDAETGVRYWMHDMKAHMWSSTLVADGKVFLGDEDGDFVTFAATREKKILSQCLVDGKEQDGPNLGAPCYSTPVVANGVLYVSSNTHLFAIHDASTKTAEPPTDPR